MRTVNSKCPLLGLEGDCACNYHYVMFSTARALLTDRQIELVRPAMPIRWRGEGAQPRGGREIRLRRFVARDSARHHNRAGYAFEKTALFARKILSVDLGNDDADSRFSNARPVVQDNLLSGERQRRFCRPYPGTKVRGEHEHS